MSQETRYNLITPRRPDSAPYSPGSPESPQSPDIDEVSASLAEISDGTPPGDPDHAANAALWVDTLEGKETMYWHEIEKEMAQVSTKWPGVLFTVDCQGQTPDDLWRVYAQDGMYQVVKPALIYPDADPAGWRKP